MGFIENLFGDSDDEEQPIPDKPDDAGTYSKEVTVPVYDTTFHYKNGDVETIRTYGRYDTEPDHIDYKVELYASSKYKKNGARKKFNRKTMSFEVLTRDPIDELVGHETWKIEWEFDYRKETWRDGSFKKWDGRSGNANAELIDGVEDDSEE